MARTTWILQGSNGKQYTLKHEVTTQGDEYFYIDGSVFLYVTPATESGLYDMKVYPFGWFIPAMTDQEVLNFISTWIAYLQPEKEG
jgi:hypothetical protein